MKEKIAILQVSDTGPLESLVVMLRSAGYTCYLPTAKLQDRLRSIGCDTVLSIENLVKGMGYDWPMKLPSLGVTDMMREGVVFVDVKAQRSYHKIIQHWPTLTNRVLWYRINGGAPEHVIKAGGFDCGDEVNPPCPVLTPNQWYKGLPNAYTCWPPFHRIADYGNHSRLQGGYEPPVCLIHNLAGWGYQDLLPVINDMGVLCYGDRSPNGLIPHSDVAYTLSNALAMIHLKSSDAPGYAIYEALAARCPIICTRRLIWRCKMQELLIPGETCLVFDRETHDALSAKDVEYCKREIANHLAYLSDPANNARIGEQGARRLKEVMWSTEKSECVDSFKAFMAHYFGA